MRILFMMIFKGGLAYAATHIQTVNMKTDQILLVKTALGIATIIEAPETIQSAIIGDQSGFRIEYLDRAVTIKPLRASARTNLYLQTAGGRYDLRLETGRQEGADYIVYLKKAGGMAPAVWRNVGRSVVGKHITLKCLRVARLPNGMFLLDLKISSMTKLQIKPEYVWLREGKDSKVIHGLFLSSLDVAKDRPVMMGLTISKSDLIKDLPVVVSMELSGDSVNLRLPAEVLWK